MTTSVDIQGMILAQQDFQHALDEINTCYSSMTEERDTLAANWAGEAASAFGQALQNWLDDLYQVQQQLAIMTETLSEHTGIYTNTNETSQEVAAAFTQGLSGLEGLPGGSLLAARVEAKRFYRSTKPAMARQREAYRSLDPTQSTPRMAVEEPLAPTQSFRRLLPMEQGMAVEEPPAPKRSFSRLLPMEPAMAVEEPLAPRVLAEHYQGEPMGELYQGTPALSEPALPRDYGVPPTPLLPEESYPALPRVVPDPAPGG